MFYGQSGVNIRAGNETQDYTFSIRHTNGQGTPQGTFKIEVKNSTKIQHTGPDVGGRKRYSRGTPHTYKASVN